MADAHLGDGSNLLHLELRRDLDGAERRFPTLRLVLFGALRHARTCFTSARAQAARARGRREPRQPR
jgi:hypothetical protein